MRIINPRVAPIRFWWSGSVITHMGRRPFLKSDRSERDEPRFVLEQRLVQVGKKLSAEEQLHLLQKILSNSLLQEKFDRVWSKAEIIAAM